MKENRAPILAAHPAVLLHQDHHQNRLALSQLAQIANADVKIYRLVEAHLIALVQRVRFRKGVKPLIHAGFGPSR
jgi:hypothetical protein